LDAVAATNKSPATNKAPKRAIERAREKAQRRQELIDVAAEIFHDKGYDATSIQDIANELGILKGSLYYYIDSKDDLLYEVVQEVHEAGLVHIAACRALEADAITTLRFFIRGHITLMREQWAKIGVFLRDYRSLSKKRRDQVIKERAEYLAYVEEVVKQGQKEGSIPANHDPRLATLAVLGMLNWMYEWYRPNAEVDPEFVAQEFTSLALGALTAPMEKRPARATRAAAR